MTKKNAFPEQVLVLCDENGVPTGTEKRARCHTGKGLLHQAIQLSIRDARGLVLLHKRRAELWDGFWDLGGATHPLMRGDEAETRLDAAWRCLHAEWGLAAPLYEKFAFTYHASEPRGSEHEHCTLFECTITHEDAKLNPDYAYTIAWMELSQCAKAVKADPDMFTPWAKITIERLWAEHLEAETEVPTAK